MREKLARSLHEWLHRHRVFAALRDSRCSWWPLAWVMLGSTWKEIFIWQWWEREREESHVGMPLHFLFHCGNHKFPMLLGSKAMCELNGRYPGNKGRGGHFSKASSAAFHRCLFSVFLQNILLLFVLTLAALPPPAAIWKDTLNLIIVIACQLMGRPGPWGMT